MKTLQLVDVSQQDPTGQPVRRLLETFVVDDAGLLVPPPTDEELSGVTTEAQLRRHYDYSSFVHLEEVDPLPPSMEPRGSIS